MTQRQKAIIHIGAGEMQIESIKIAKDLGLYVIATDKNINAPGIQFADELIHCADDDEQKLFELAIKTNQEFDVIGAYTSSNFGLMAVARIHFELGLLGCRYHNTRLSMNNYQSKQYWLENGVAAPKADIVENKSDIKKLNLNFPLTIKPVDSRGKQKIFSVNNKQELLQKIDSAFEYSNEILLEENIKGKHYDSIGVMWHGKFIPMGISNRYFSEPPHHVSTWGHTPSDLTESEQHTIYKLTEDAAIALGLDYTPIKANLVYSKSQLYITEIAPRFHSDAFTSKLISISGASSPVKSLLALRINNQHEVNDNFSSKKKIIWKVLFPIDHNVDFTLLEDLHVTSIFLNHKKISTRHKDNTSRQGFIWDEVADGESYASHYQKLSQQLKGFLQ
jgi:biotin carboxylase